MHRRALELFALAGKGVFGLVAGVILGVVGIIQAVRGANESAYVLVLVALVALAVVLCWIAYQALCQRDEARSKEEGQSGVSNHYNGPVTIVQGQPFAEPEPSLQHKPVGPAWAARADRHIVNLHDYVEFPKDGPPTIRDREFRNVILRGPIWLAPDKTTITESTFAVGADEVWAMLWPLKAGTEKIGIVSFENCLIKQCTLQHIGWVGTQEDIAHFVQDTRESSKQLSS